MAYLTHIHCSICNKTKHEIINYDHSNICSDCWSKSISRAKRTYLAGLKGLTTEERLEILEEKMYDLNGDTRLKYLESQFVQY